MDLREATLHVVGTSPLIVHAWSEKAKKQSSLKSATSSTTRPHDAAGCR
jgi:hypothetical protein